MKDFLNKLMISVLVVIFMAAFSFLFPQPTLLHFIALLLVVLFFYYLVFPALSEATKCLKVKWKKYFPKIGILSGNIESPIREYKCQHSNSGVTAGMWLTEIKRALKTKKVKVIPTSKIDDNFAIIINPFGDIYPEEDTKLHTTFYKICKFIESGGIFICTGGAFWAHQNTKISEEAEWVFVKTQEGKQSLKDSFLYKEFGIVTTGEIFSGKDIVLQEPIEIEVYQKEEDKTYIGTLVENHTKINRFRSLMSESSNYIPLLREKEDKSFPLAVVQYGNGYLMHAGMHLAGIKTKEFSILINAMKSIVDNKLKKF